MIITARKQAMREESLARRPALRLAAPDAAWRMARNFIAAIPLPPASVVSAFVAIGEETDPSPLIDLLRKEGHSIALPRVVRKGEKLAFHLYGPGATLVPGVFGLSQPGKDWPEAIPDVLVVPSSPSMRAETGSAMARGSTTGRSRRCVPLAKFLRPALRLPGRKSRMFRIATATSRSTGSSPNWAPAGSKGSRCESS